MTPEDLVVPFTTCVLMAALFAVMHRCRRVENHIEAVLAEKKQARKELSRALTSMADRLHRVEQLEGLLYEVLARQEQMLAAQKQTRDATEKSDHALRRVDASLTSLADGLLRVDATFETLALRLAVQVDAPRSLPCAAAEIEARPTFHFLHSTAGFVTYDSDCESADHEAGTPRECPRMKAIPAAAGRVPTKQLTSGTTTADCASAHTDHRTQGGPHNAGTRQTTAARLPPASSMDNDKAKSSQPPSFLELTGFQDPRLDRRPRALPDKPALSSIARHDDGNIAGSTLGLRDDAMDPLPHPVRPPPRRADKEFLSRDDRAAGPPDRAARGARMLNWRSTPVLGRNMMRQGPLRIPTTDTYVSSAPPKHRRRSSSTSSAKPVSKRSLSSGVLFYAHVVEQQAKRDAREAAKLAGAARSESPPPRVPACSPIAAALQGVKKWASFGR
jgi:hypothetical protein